MASECHKLKRLWNNLRIPVLLGLGLLSLTWPAAAEEPLPVFDAAEHEIERIVVEFPYPDSLTPGQKRTTGRAVELLVGYLNTAFQNKGLDIQAEAGSIPAICGIRDSIESLRQRRKNIDTLYALVRNNFLNIALVPCLPGVGPVNLPFPSDWSQIDSDPNIRRGSCSGQQYTIWTEYVLCRVRPDLDVIVYELHKAKGVRDE